MSDGMNPCDCCERKNKASGCSNCILDVHGIGTCENYECMLNYDGGCLLGMDDECKCSTAYEDDYTNHDCSECENITEGDDGTFYCCLNQEEVGEYDLACTDFKEREE